MSRNQTNQMGLSQKLMSSNLCCYMESGLENLRKHYEDDEDNDY